MSNGMASAGCVVGDNFRTEGVDATRNMAAVMIGQSKGLVFSVRT